MPSPYRWFGKKAAKATVRHSVHGTVSKAARTPIRSSTLLVAGGLLGAAVGFLAGRRTAKPATGAAPVAQPPAGPPPSNTHAATPRAAEAPGQRPA